MTEVQKWQNFPKSNGIRFFCKYAYIYLHIASYLTYQITVKINKMSCAERTELTDGSKP